jgi:hypothetical protein
MEHLQKGQTNLRLGPFKISHEMIEILSHSLSLSLSLSPVRTWEGIYGE